MKIVLSWLSDFAPLPATTSTPSPTRSTSLGLAVEAIDRVGAPVPGVITAAVLRTERHPDAAKVQRVCVDAGDGERAARVVRRVQHRARRRRPAGRRSAP